MQQFNSLLENHQGKLIIVWGWRVKQSCEAIGSQSLHEQVDQLQVKITEKMSQWSIVLLASGNSNLR